MEPTKAEDDARSSRRRRPRQPSRMPCLSLAPGSAMLQTRTSVRMACEASRCLILTGARHTQ